jgi:hypothetical protein
MMRPMTGHRPDAFAHASLVEQRGMALLLPFLEARAFQGRIVSTARGTLAREVGLRRMNIRQRALWDGPVGSRAAAGGARCKHHPDAA